MDAHRYQQIKAILLDALDLSPADRPAFLARWCGDDVALRTEVESLLAHDAEDDFLGPIVPSLAPAMLESSRESPEVQDAEKLDPLLGETFAHYRVLRRIGGGGMGVVYLAEDTRLGRQVALKFLQPDLLFSEGAEARFFREARAVAALDHPNICTLYGIERTPAGQVFLVMAFYQGETLKQKLVQGPIPWPAAVDIVRQVGHGLMAAHASGIIHRDVKPGNIMVGDGFIKVLDFGIAKVADGAGLTVAGASLGTAGYVSPEQAEGRSVDQRTDIWALGVVAYEVITGQRPFEAGARAIARPRELCPDLPEAIDTAVLRALSLAPEDRFQSVREFVAALDATRDVDPIVSIRVIPFSCVIDHGDDAELGPALTDAIADALSVASRLVVIRGRRMDDEPRGDERRSRNVVGPVLTGTLVATRGSARIEATVLDGASGQVVAEWVLEQPRSALRGMVNGLARRVIKRMGVRLHADEARELAQDPTDATDWYSAYLRGRLHLAASSDSSPALAVAQFERAIVAASLEALPHAGLAEALVRVIAMECRADRDLLAATAKEALAKALALDAASSDVQFAAAEVACRVDWAPAAAEAQLKEILRRRPGHGRAALRLAECSLTTGHPDAVRECGRFLEERYPDSSTVLSRLGRIHHFAREYGESVRVLRAAVRGGADDFVARIDLALSLIKTGEFTEAQVECHRALESDASQAVLVAAAGNAARARGNLKRHAAAGRFLAALQERTHVPTCCFTLLSASFGATGRPLEYLDGYDPTVGLAKFLGFAPINGSLSAVVECVGLIAYLGVDPDFDRVYTVSSVRALLARLDAETL